MALSICDSLVHPECNKASFKKLYNSITARGITSAFAVSLPNQIDLDHQKYFDLTNETPGLTPVAAICSIYSPEIELSAIQDIGYRHIKLHPRLLNKPIGNNFDYYDQIFAWSALHGIVVFLCTYNSWGVENLASEDPMHTLGRLIANNPTGKYVLLHGGSTNILRYYEHFRNIENVFLDLSYTLIHFYQTSLFNDLKFLANRFDKRLLVGSDYPEFSHDEFAHIVGELVADLALEKANNIVHHNWNAVRDGNI